VSDTLARISGYKGNKNNIWDEDGKMWSMKVKKYIYQAIKQKEQSKSKRQDCRLV